MSWVNQIGHRNPQFLRECRGHLKSRSIIAALGTSVLMQVLLYLSIFEGQPWANTAEKWFSISNVFTWGLPYFLFTVGGYYLVNDLVQEEKRGTLNFIRLSPRPARSILLGKLLGVPILPYLVVLSVIPLHGWSLLKAKIPITFFFSYYSLLIITAFLCFSLALIVGITHQLRPKQSPVAIIFAGLGLFLFAPIFMSWNIGTSWFYVQNVSDLFRGGNNFSPASWLYVSLIDNSLWAYGFNLINLAIMIGLVWAMLERLFHQPRTTLISKRLSYLLTAYVTVLVCGFSVHGETQGLDLAELFVGLYVVIFGLVLLFLLALTPHRQQIFDWLNYPRTDISSLLWADKSPAVLAIGVNIVIAGLPVIPLLLLASLGGRPLAYVLLIPPSIALSWLIYAAITQLIFTTNVRTPALWATGTVILLIIVPLILMWVFQRGSLSPLWLTYRTFLGYPFYDYREPGLASAVVIGIALQSLFLVSLLAFLQRRINKLRRLATVKNAVIAQ